MAWLLNYQRVYHSHTSLPPQSASRTSKISQHGEAALEGCQQQRPEAAQAAGFRLALSVLVGFPATHLH